jgi:agmatinase
VGVGAAAEQALEWAKADTQAVYLTVDLDVLNPGEAPGTGWPEPGGLTGQQVIDFVRLAAPHIAAMDIAELNPVFDSPARTTAILGRACFWTASRPGCDYCRGRFPSHHSMRWR